jgi:alpha-mannosidase
MNEIHTDVMENQSVRLEIDAWNGAIRSIYHKPAGAEWVDPERPYAGTIVRELDNGNFWEYNGHCKGDALLPMNRDHPLLAEGDARAAFSHHYGGDGRVRNGSARTEYNVSFAFGKGFFTTRVRVYEGLPRVDIRTTLVNQDERVRYRMAIPTTLLDGTVTQEIPFGAIERPRGEFPAQNWMDYGDGSIGLAILNRGLPGNNVHDGVMMLSLLKCTALKEGYGEGGGYNRSMKSTDGYEIGVTHAFDYAILPHEGDWRDADLVRRGAEFNRPLLVRKARASSGSLPARYSFVQVEGCGDVSSVRSEGDRVSIRLYETNGLGGESRICFGSAIASASETNLIGQGAEPALVERDGRSVQCVLGPFEIKTFEVRFAASSAGGGEQ